MTSARVLSGDVFPIAVVAVGSVAVVTAIIGFLIALGASYDESQRQTIERIERNEAADGGEIDG